MGKTLQATNFQSTLKPQTKSFIKKKASKTFAFQKNRKVKNFIFFKSKLFNHFTLNLSTQKKEKRSIKKNQDGRRNEIQSNHRRNDKNVCPRVGQSVGLLSQRREADQIRSGGRRENRAPVVDFARRPILRFQQEMHHHVNTTGSLDVNDPHSPNSLNAIQQFERLFMSLALSLAIGHHHHHRRKSRNERSATASR